MTELQAHIAAGLSSIVAVLSGAGVFGQSTGTLIVTIGGVVVALAFEILNLFHVKVRAATRK